MWATGQVTITVESELGNEEDDDADQSPPGFPVAYIDISETTVSHDYASYISLLRGSPVLTTNSTEEELSEVYLTENHPLYDVTIVGVYPRYLKIFTRLNINSKADLVTFAQEKRETNRDAISRLNPETKISATIPFDGLVSVDRVLSIVKQYNLEVLRFRFTAQNGQEIVRGQGTSRETEPIPLNELNEFIKGYKLLGLQSIDIKAKPTLFNALVNEGVIYSLDFAAYLTVLNAGINLSQYDEVQWYTEDASWYLNFEYTS